MPSPPPPSVHHIHPLPLSKISSALVYYYTCPTRHSTLLLSTTTHRYYYHVDNSNAAPSNYVRIIATHYYRCRWLITNISMIISTATTQRCCVIQYAIITGQTSNRSWSWCWLLSRWLLPCQNDFLYNCLENSHHYLTFFLSTAYILTVTTTTIHQRISHFIRYLYFTQQRRNMIHYYILWTLRESLMSDVLPLSSWRSIYIRIGEVGGINLVHLASTWRQRHIWRSLSRGTPHHYFHTALLLQDAVWGYVMSDE